MIDGKQMYEFIKKYRPNDLGTAIIDYVEQLKADKQALKEQLTLTDVGSSLPFENSESKLCKTCNGNGVMWFNKK